MEFVVYILRAETNGSLYVGHTNNLPRRLEQHNNHSGKSYTAKRGPWVLAYKEEYAERSAAVMRERFLKSRAGAREKKQLAGVLIDSVG